MCLPTFDFDDDEHAGLVRLLRETIAADRFPLSLRVRTLRRILNKLDPRPAGVPVPAPKPSERPSWALAKKRRR